MASSRSSTDELQRDTSSSDQSTPAIRKSCQFCRLRKIRCSGQRICEACRSRNLDCIYERELFKGRPRNSESGTSRCSANKTGSRNESEVSSQGLSRSVTRELSSEGAKRHRRPISVSGTSDEGTRSSSLPVIMDTVTETVSIATKLKQTMRRKFLEPSSSEYIRRDALSSPSTSESPSSSSASQSDNDGFHTQPPQASELHQKLFSNLTQSLIELVCLKFGSLGFQNPSNSPTRYIAHSLCMDRTTTIAESDPESARIASDFNDHKTRQMFEAWFIHHPLSFILSKTLLLNHHRTGDLDSALLASVLADAVLITEDRSSESSKQLIAKAEADIHSRTSESPTISMIQTLVLLGWHHLCFASARRGYCYLECARSATVEFQISISDGSNLGRDWINGTDVGKVESELVQRLYWTTFAFEIWVALSMDATSHNTMPLNAPIDFPPVNERSSVVLSLDIESGNVATIAVQRQSLRQLWPLSHVASIVNPIYALYPRRLVDSPASCGRWEYRTLSKLHHLLKGPGTVSDVCQNVRTVLNESLQQLQEQLEDYPSKTLIAFAYFILIIQLFFPRNEHGYQPSNIGDAVADGVLQAISRLRSTLQLDSLFSSSSAADSGDSEFMKASIQNLALDTCARALWFILEAGKSSTTENTSHVRLHYGEMLELCNDLYILSKDPKLHVIPTARTIKRRLKEVKRYLENIQLVPPHTAMSQWVDHSTSEMFDLISDTGEAMPQVAPATFASFDNIVADPNNMQWQ